MTQTDPAIDPLEFREVMGHYPTGVVLVTGRHPDGEELAAIMGSFASVSLEPPLVSFMPMKTSRSFERIRECESLCINVLTAEQEAAGRAIARRKEDKFEGLDTYASPSGDPILAGSLAWIDVRLEDVIEAGDHWIAMCRVRELKVENPASPLIFFQGGYGRFAAPSLVARIDEDIVGAVNKALVARPELERLATRFDCEAAVMTQVNRDELASVAAATGPSVSLEENIGVRIPLIPPLGDMFVAAHGEEMTEHWLSRSIGASEEDLASFRERLEFVRRNGYSLSYLPEEDVNPYYDMIEATQIYSRGGLTPAEERDVRERISRAVVCYQVRTIQPERRYDIGSVVVPVKDADGKLVHVMRMSQLPRQASGQQIREWIEALKGAAKRVAADLAAGAGNTAS